MTNTLKQRMAEVALTAWGYDLNYDVAHAGDYHQACTAAQAILDMPEFAGVQQNMGDASKEDAGLGLPGNAVCAPSPTQTTREAFEQWYWELLGVDAMLPDGTWATNNARNCWLSYQASRTHLLALLDKTETVEVVAKAAFKEFANQGKTHKVYDFKAIAKASLSALKDLV